MNETNLYDLESDWERRGELDGELLERIPTDLIASGEILYRQGEEPTEFSVLRVGRIRVEKRAKDGSTSLLALPGPGEPVGAVAVVNEFPYPANVTAYEDTVVYRFSSDLIPVLKETVPAWFSELMGEAAGRAAGLAERFESLRTRKIKQRIAGQLVDLAQQHGESADGTVRLDLRLTRQMLADMVGCRVEGAIRVMSQWEQDGIIRTENSRITLLEPGKIQSVAGDQSP